MRERERCIIIFFQMPTVETSIQSLHNLISSDPDSLSPLQLAIAVSALEKYIPDIPNNDNVRRV